MENPYCSCKLTRHHAGTAAAGQTGVAPWDSAEAGRPDRGGFGGLVLPGTGAFPRPHSPHRPPSKHGPPADTLALITSGLKGRERRR